MFRFNIFSQKKQMLDYDKEKKRPVLRSSICTGETAAGLKDLRTGKFEEIMLIRDAKDLEDFKKMVGTEEIPKEY